MVPSAVTRWPPRGSPATETGSSASEAGSAQKVGASKMATCAGDPFMMDLRELAATSDSGGSVPTAIDGKAAPAVDVTRHNFEVMLPIVRRYLEACDFFAFDCEMTGLFLEGQNHNYLDDMEERYARIARAAQSFVINQFGLSCFQRQEEPGPDGETQYLAATFNFYLFPRSARGPAYVASRRFMCDAESLSFLASQGFDFNRCIYDGVPFIPVKQRDEMLRQLDRDTNTVLGAGEGPRNHVELTKPEDQMFVQELVESVRDWLASGTTDPLDLPAVNGYLRLLTYQALARPEHFGGPPENGAPDWHPGFVVKKVNDERNCTRVRLVRCALVTEASALDAADREERRRAVMAAAGFAAVWEAIRECGRPGVGHNCLFDVAYSIAQFGEGQLPRTWDGFKHVTAHWFRGGLFDTKHICRQLPDLLGSETSLATMFSSLVPQDFGPTGSGERRGDERV
ncbi:hypothetical protein Vafri_14886 [Volvox africanus]|uniref:Uncharacterized protein n=1 Tax=Volvox africanus TaxID=51714 RepID=A0A8J4F821_9CHLO|nr:hypothetical protein Vafri_14886 [Volvox africanus]